MSKKSRAKNCNRCARRLTHKNRVQRRAVCKNCLRADSAAYYKKNKQKIIATVKKYLLKNRDKNRDKERAYHRLYRLKNRKKIREYAREYMRKYREN